MKYMKEKTCPECANHCLVSALQCGKGMAYFGLRGQEPDADAQTLEARLVALLRRCGHHLHDNAGRGADAAALTAALTGADKAALETLLQKLLAAWKNGA